MAAEEPEVSLLSINVWLAGRSYRIRIPAEQEAAVRRAVKNADDRIIELRQHYAGKDDQDFVAMCLLMYATAEVNSTSSSGAGSEDIDSLTQKIDKALNKDQAPSQ